MPDGGERERPRVGATLGEVDQDFLGALRNSDRLRFGPDLGLRIVVAGHGDTVSRLMGSSDPAAVGRFLRQNGMTHDSLLREGAAYWLPKPSTAPSREDEEVGLRVLGRDEARKRRARPAPAPMPASVVPASWLTPSPEGFPDAARRWRRQPGASRGDWRNESLAAKAMVGTLAQGVGEAMGLFRGGGHTATGAARGALFALRLASPADALFGNSAHLQLVDQALRGAVGLDRFVADPDFRRAQVDAFRQRYDPTYAPIAPTLGEEAAQAFRMGENHGEAIFDIASVVAGGGFTKSAAGLGRVALAADARELAFLSANPDLAAYFAQPYPKRGLSHHILARQTKLPALLGGGSLPDWIMESPFNKIAADGLTRRDQYRNHVGSDSYFRGGPVKAEFGGGQWSADDLGWTLYGPVDRFFFGTSPLTKAVFGPPLLMGPALNEIQRAPQ